MNPDWIKLVDDLEKANLLTNPIILNAFSRIDRKFFVRKVDIEFAYENYPLSIGYNQTISQPYTVAFMIDLLELEKGDHVLDVGSGSGWTCALIASSVGEKGSVVGVEIVRELIEFSNKNLLNYPDLNAKIISAKKGVIGIPGKKFDKILVSASGKEFPEELLDQLKPNGTIVIPILNSIWKYRKDENGIVEKSEYPGFVFVPLV